MDFDFDNFDDVNPTADFLPDDEQYTDEDTEIDLGFSNNEQDTNEDTEIDLGFFNNEQEARKPVRRKPAGFSGGVSKAPEVRNPSFNNVADTVSDNSDNSFKSGLIQGMAFGCIFGAILIILVKFVF